MTCRPRGGLTRLRSEKRFAGRTCGCVSTIPLSDPDDRNRRRALHRRVIGSATKDVLADTDARRSLGHVCEWLLCPPAADSVGDRYHWGEIGRNPEAQNVGCRAADEDGGSARTVPIPRELAGYPDAT